MFVHAAALKLESRYSSSKIQASVEPPHATAMLRWYDVACAWPMIEAYLGWLPCLALQTCARRCEPSQPSLMRLMGHLAACGLRLPLAPQLPFGILVRVLHTLALSRVRCHDDPALRGPWWHGFTLPRLEQRVAVRYLRQNPARRWGSGVRGSPIGAERLPTVFPETAFGAAVRSLQERGRDFYVHRIRSRRYRDHHGYIEGLKVEVTTLYCVVMDFEVLLRCTRASDFDPAATPSNSETDTP